MAFPAVALKSCINEDGFLMILSVVDSRESNIKSQKAEMAMFS